MTKYTQAELKQLLAERTQELEDINAELMRSNEELSQFAYVVSHDLKAPLRAIYNLSTWIVEDSSKGKDVTSYVSMLLPRVKRMENLINGLLEYSRIGRQHTEIEDVNVTQVIQDAVRDLPPGSPFICVEGPFPVVRGNKTRILQIFNNLLCNAIKHHHDLPHAEIRVSCEDVGNEWVFCVADNGPGIDPKDHEKVFHIFHTAKPKDECNGAGIGLSIVRKIAEELDGRAWVESELGQGAKFFVSFPK